MGKLNRSRYYNFLHGKLLSRMHNGVTGTTKQKIAVGFENSYLELFLQ